MVSQRFSAGKLIKRKTKPQGRRPFIEDVADCAFMRLLWLTWLRTATHLRSVL